MEVHDGVTQSLARGIIDDLGPSVLVDVGLIPTIEEYLERVENESLYD